MCGIAGIAGRQEAQWISSMNDAIVHRGPDDAGEYRDSEAELSFAMHRLSILDLGSGHQPMRNEDGSLCIVYNGEIFNSPDLRRQLEQQGRKFRTANSDTEVLLHLYESDSESMLSRLNGMFAFVIHDRRRNVLFGARDHAGIKPLYYTRTGSQFAFASEIKALLQLPWVTRDVDEESLFHYMSLRFVPGESSIFRNIRRVPPAHWFCYDLHEHRLQLTRYWSLSFDRQEMRSTGEWTAQVRSSLRDAVKRWALSDVPVACSLSGGLDSSALVGLLAESGYSRIRTYSLGFAGTGEEEWNELPLARQVAQKWGTDHHELVLAPDDLLQDLVSMVWHLDEPYGGGLPSWQVFKFMSNDVKVGFTGTGGDELFGDYGRYRGLERSQEPATRLAGRVLKGAAPVLTRIPDSILDNRRKQELVHFDEAEKDPFRWHYFHSYYYLTDEIKRQSVFAKAADLPDTSILLEKYYLAARSKDPRDALMHLSFSTQLPDEFLLMTDRFSMAHSIEGRVPFLDLEFVKQVCSIPGDVRTRSNDLKYLLRKAIADLLPSDLLTARKRGFVIPTASWLRGKLRPLVERMLSREMLRRQGFFRPEFYDLYVQPHMDARADHHAQIWTALMFQLWHTVFIEQRNFSAPTYRWQDLC